MLTVCGESDKQFVSSGEKKMQKDDLFLLSFDALQLIYYGSFCNHSKEKISPADFLMTR